MCNLSKILFLFIAISFFSTSYAADHNHDWVKVGEGTTGIGTVQSFVDMNDIHRMNSEIISFRFVSNVPSANASHVITLLMNCNTNHYNIIDDRVYAGLYGNGEASESVSHSKDFILVKGTQLESVARLVCAKKI